MKREIHIYPIILMGCLCSILSCTGSKQAVDSVKNDSLYKSLAAKRVQLPNQ